MKARLALALALLPWSLACESSPDHPPSGGSIDAGRPNDVGVPDTSVLDSGAEDAALADVGVDGGAPDGGAPMSIPDPGTGNDDWGNNVVNTCCSTPSTAYPVGIVTMNTGYVQGNIDASTGDFFYVFRAGPALTTLTFTGFLTLDLLDLHDGAGLVFGPVIPATSTGQNTATWPVMPDHIYVVHLHSPQSGFF